MTRFPLGRIIDWLAGWFIRKTETTHHLAPECEVDSRMLFRTRLWGGNIETGKDET